MRNLSIILAIFLLFGCGDDPKKAASNNVDSNNTSFPGGSSGNNTPGNTANVPQFELGNDSAEVSTLNGATVCEKGTAYFNSAINYDQAQKIECSTTAYFAADDGTAETDTDLRAACQNAYDQCMAEDFDRPVVTSEGCVVVTEGCGATVGLFEACIEGQVARNLRVLELLDCSKATIDVSPFANDEEPASCTQLNAECPDLLGN